MEADALRYGIPGHGLVDGFRRAALDRPAYVKSREWEAFSGGWSLYASVELLELDLLPVSDGGFGIYGQELVAFASLLVDLGLHDRGWSVEQAVESLMEWTPLQRLAAEEIVLRSITFPGRVAEPAIGLLRIRAFRRRYQEELGVNFDGAEFHGALLSGGPIHISQCGARLKLWIEARPKDPDPPK